MTNLEIKIEEEFTSEKLDKIRQSHYHTGENGILAEFYVEDLIKLIEQEKAKAVEETLALIPYKRVSIKKLKKKYLKNND